MQSNSNICCKFVLKEILRIVRKGSQFWTIFGFMNIARFWPFFSNSTLLIMKSCSKSTAENQGKILWLIPRWDGRQSVGASSFGWFLGGSGWFLLVEGDFRWFKVVCCFSSYTNVTAYRRVNSSLHSSFLFKVKQQEKYYCCLVT